MRLVPCRRSLALSLALAGAAVLAAGCGDGEPQADGAGIIQLGDDVVPSSILGLTVEREDVAAKLEGVDRAYVESTGLYTLRDGDLLQATLQVSRFDDDVDPSDPVFQQSVVSQIGSTEPKAFRMGDQIVYLTASKRQAVAIWFDEDAFGVLSTLETFDRSRTLLREAMRLEL